MRGNPETYDTTDFENAETDANFFAPIQHLVIHVSGVVQGVGFRPFIYRLAQEHKLFGSVRNNHGGVVIDAQGKAADLRQFLIELRTRAPEVSSVTRVDLTTLPVAEL